MFFWWFRYIFSVRLYLFQRWMFQNVFWCFGVFCIVDYYFECVYRIRCIFLFIGTYLQDIFWYFSHLLNKCPRSVNNSRTKDSLRFFGILGVLNGPLHPPPPASMSKSPSGWTNRTKTRYLLIFINFVQTFEKMILKCLRCVAVVGWDVSEASLGRVTSLKRPWFSMF